MPLSLPEIKRPDRAILVLLQKHLDNLTKPSGSLGRLEELARNFGLMRGSTDLILQKRAIFTFAADHGISRAGVSAYPREVTAQMVFNFIGGGAAINVLCRHYGIQNVVVDAGVDCGRQQSAVFHYVCRLSGIGSSIPSWSRRAAPAGRERMEMS